MKPEFGDTIDLLDLQKARASMKLIFLYFIKYANTIVDEREIPITIKFIEIMLTIKVLT
jgi:hypothetical protein